jgi:hypothetical protein
MACERPRDSEALSDLLLALRGLLDATTEAGEASLALRVAALCAEDGQRRAVQRRVTAALALERVVMGGAGKVPADSPRALVAEIEGHVRALLRDLLCGYLDADLKGVADDILLEANPEFIEIEARDLRARQEPAAPPVAAAPAAVPVTEELDTSELEPVAVEDERPRQPRLDGVTPSDDWAWDEPEDYSAPV